MIFWKDCHYRKVLSDAWKKGSHTSIAFPFVNSLLHGIITALVIHFGYFAYVIWKENKKLKESLQILLFMFGTWNLEEELETRVQRVWKLEFLDSMDPLVLQNRFPK